MLVLDIIIIVTVLLLYKELHALSFDEEFSLIVGVPTQTLYLILLCLVALSIIVLIRVVGIILVIALLTIPATIAKQFTSNLKKLIALSMITAVVLTVIGLWLSYVFDLPSGAAIVLLLAFVFIISTGIRKFLIQKV